MLNTNIIAQAVEDIYKFNDIAGNFEPDVDLVEKVDLYNSLSFEEMSECVAAFEDENPTELLDGAVDEFVIIIGKLQLLQAAGFDVNRALKRVTENNLSKFVDVSTAKSLPEALKSPNDSNEWEYNSKYDVYVYKNEHGKIIKPSSYKPVELEDLANPSFFAVENSV